MTAADTDAEGEAAPKKTSKLPLILAIVLALAGGGGAFFALYSGMIPLGGDAAAHANTEEEKTPFELPDSGFVEIDPMIVSLGSALDDRHLRFRASLEVAKGQESTVQSVLPRIVDLLNTYLRALRFEDLEDPGALVRLRSQMLRRVQVITGPNTVRDLLIIEFVMN